MQAHPKSIAGTIAGCSYRLRASRRPKPADNGSARLCGGVGMYVQVAPLQHHSSQWRSRRSGGRHRPCLQLAGVRQRRPPLPRLCGSSSDSSNSNSSSSGLTPFSAAVTSWRFYPGGRSTLWTSWSRTRCNTQPSRGPASTRGMPLRELKMARSGHLESLPMPGNTSSCPSHWNRMAVWGRQVNLS